MGNVYTLQVGGGYKVREIDPDVAARIKADQTKYAGSAGSVARNVPSMPMKEPAIPAPPEAAAANFKVPKL